MGRPDAGGRATGLMIYASAAVGALLFAAACIAPAGASSAGTEQDGGSAQQQALQELTPEEELAAKYAPIVYLRRQDEECASGGDPFDPAPVEIVLDNPEVTLRRDEPGRPVETEGPSARDLSGKDIGFFLDFPGNPRNPGCTFDRAFQEFRGDTPAVAYAHIQKEPGFDGLALQYWFFYYFNDWNNTHEGDWEMIQLAFDAGSADEALLQDPARVAYSQHEGGETADWGEGKLEIEDGRPAVYVARGSHANYYKPGTYIGVARDGAGFGCEDSSEPLRRVPLEARLLPPSVEDADDPLAWLEFGGRWGELKGRHFDGPTGPAQKDKWERPFTWEEDLRGYSERIPEDEVVGFDPLGPICAIIGFGSSLLVAVQDQLLFVLAAGAVFFAALGLLIVEGPKRLSAAEEESLSVELGEEAGLLKRRRVLGQIGRDAASIYFGNLRAFVPIGALFIPLGILATSVQSWLQVQDWIPSQGAEVLIVFSIGGVQALIATLVLGGAVFAALVEIDTGKPATFTKVYGLLLRRLWSLLGANLRSLFHVFLLSITVVGVPWAIHRAIAWAFIGQAVIVDGQGAEDALSASARVVRGSWWRTLGIVVALAALVALPGPVISFALLLFASPPVTDLVYTVNMLLYSLLLWPFVFTASTLLYSDLKARKGL